MSEDKAVCFEALIKDVHSKSLVSGDKQTRLILEFDSANKTDVLNSLNELHKADACVKVVITP